MSAPDVAPVGGGAPVAIAGHGPVGMTLALRLASFGVRSVIVDSAPASSGEGSKAICFQRETLESFARIGCGEQVAGRGVSWATGRTYYGTTELFHVELPAVTGGAFPPFVNISQSEVEDHLHRLVEASPLVESRWSHRLEAVRQDDDGVTLELTGPDGSASVVRAAYVVGCDGARSSVRKLLGIGFPGHSHADKFLIADIRADLPFPEERRFFFSPPWNPGRTVLVHPQPDRVWRIDWQVPADTDVEEERRTGRLEQRIRQIVGDADYELVWMSTYRFHQRVAERFQDRRVFLAGDSAHLMSPFGARGLNSGVADADNLAWKLALVLDGRAPVQLLDSYEAERRPAALENVRVTNATMQFMVPPNRVRRVVRDAVLSGSVRVPQLRRFINSGKLSEPFVYTSSPIVEPGEGAVAPDGPCTVLAGDVGRPVQRVRQLYGEGFVALVFGSGPVVPVPPPQPAGGPPVRTVFVLPAGMEAMAAVPEGVIVIEGVDGVAHRAFCPDGVPNGGRLFLVRPDRHIALHRDLATTHGLDELSAWVSTAVGAAGETTPTTGRRTTTSAAR